jgi:transketolase
MGRLKSRPNLLVTLWMLSTARNDDGLANRWCRRLRTSVCSAGHNSLLIFRLATLPGYGVHASMSKLRYRIQVGVDGPGILRTVIPLPAVSI